jgi:hypothetical protein
MSDVVHILALAGMFVAGWKAGLWWQRRQLLRWIKEHQHD